MNKNKFILIRILRKLLLFAPSRKWRLLVGSYILTTGLLSCNNDRPAEKSKAEKPNKTNADTADITCYITPADTVKSNHDTIMVQVDCYDTVLPEEPNSGDDLIDNPDSVNIPIKTCYAPVPDLNQDK